MRRLLFILFLVASLLVLTSAVAYASPLTEDVPGTANEGDRIGEAIGTLGLYAAMMAVLAVGTEVVIDSIRPIFGLQRKVTSEEAFSKLQQWLPGLVKDLGLPEEAEGRLTESIDELKKVTKTFSGNVEKAQSIIQEQWPMIVKDLAVNSVDKILKDHWSTIESQLKGLQGVDVDAVHAWLTGTLNTLKGTSVADIESHLASLNALLDAVEEQRNEIQGPARKLWRWLRNRLIDWGESVEEKATGGDWLSKFIRNLLFLPAYLEYGWAELRGTRKGKAIFGIKNKKLGKLEDFEPVATIQQAAQRILKADRQQGLEEDKRIKWLRIISAVVGIALAATLQIDSLLLLEPVLGNAANAFRDPPSAGAETVPPEEWYTLGDIIGVPREDDKDPQSDFVLPGVLGARVLGDALKALLVLTPGIYLSGLGAAAGSSFWHDMLDKLRSAKEVAGQVKGLAEVTKELTG